MEISPVRLDRVQRNHRARWDINRSAGTTVQLVGHLGVVDLPAGVDLVDHGMQGVPNGILCGDVNAVHLAADTKVRAGVNAQAGTANNTVEKEFEHAGVGGVGSSDKFSLVGVGLRDVSVEIALQANVVIIEGAVWESAIKKV